MLGAGNQQTFTASRTANWSVTGGGTIAPGAGLSTNLTVANPIPNGLLSLTVTATEQGGSGSKSIIVPLMTPVSISGAVTTLNPGGQAQYSANIPVTWELSPASAGTVSPASTAANALTVVTIFNSPPGSPAVVTLTARDARAATDSRFQNNTATRNIGIQYGGPPTATGSLSVSYYNNGSAAAGWTFGFSDPLGPQNIAWMQVHFSGTTAQSVPFSCALLVYSYGAVYLYNDAGTAWVAGAIGDSTPLRNSQCLIELKGLRIYDQGGTRFLEVPAYMNPQFLGPRDIWLSVANNQGQVPPGVWWKISSGWNMYYNSSDGSLAIHPNQGTNVSQDFRTSAISNAPGRDIPMMSMYAKDLSNNSCQVLLYPGYNWAYVVTNNPYGTDSSYLTATTYVMNTLRCSVPVSSIKFTSYLQASPAAPYAFFDAQMQANSPIRGTTQYMYGTMYFSINGGWYWTPDQYVGGWTIPYNPL